MAHLKSNLVQRGPRGLMSIRRTFMLIDENSDKRIQFSEFEKMFKRYRFNLSQESGNNAEETGFRKNKRLIQS